MGRAETHRSQIRQLLLSYDRYECSNHRMVRNHFTLAQTGDVVHPAIAAK